MKGNFFTKIISIIIYAVTPKKWHEGIKARIDKIKLAMTANKELKVFWYIVFLPIVLSFSLVGAFLKSIFILISPYIYGNSRFILNQLYKDIVQDKRGAKLSLKRAKLTADLVIKGREKQVRFGDKNPDKTFFVIRPYYYLEANELATTIANLLYHYYRNLQHLSHAVEHGWIPVVDWQSYGPFPHGEDYPINGTTNCWEYFWNQPSEYTLEEVYQSKNVILSTRNSVSYRYMPTMAIQAPFSRYAAKLVKFCPKYDALFTLNAPTAEYIQKWQDKLFEPDYRILGVSVRGASYGASNIPGHPIQPAMKDLITAIYKYMEEWELDHIFFTCEMVSAVEMIQEEFGDKVIVLPRQRYEKLPTAEDNPLYEPGVRYQTNLDYLTEMVLLSRCTCLLAGMSGGVRCAIIWNAGNYEKTKIYENGMW